MFFEAVVIQVSPGRLRRTADAQWIALGQDLGGFLPFSWLPPLAILPILTSLLAWHQADQDGREEWPCKWMRLLVWLTEEKAGKQDHEVTGLQTV